MQDWSALAFAHGEPQDLERNLGLKLLLDALFHFESSPLRRQLLETGLLHQVQAQLEESFLEPMTSIVFMGLEVDNHELLRELLFFSLEDLARRGLDPELIAAVIKQWRLMILEGLPQSEMPQGIHLSLLALEHWDRGVDPLCASGRTRQTAPKRSAACPA